MSSDLSFDHTATEWRTARPDEQAVTPEAVQWPLGAAFPAVSQSMSAWWEATKDEHQWPPQDGNRTFLSISPFGSSASSPTGSELRSSQPEVTDGSLASRRQRDELRISTWPITGLGRKSSVGHNRSLSQPHTKVASSIKAATAPPPLPNSHKRMPSMPSSTQTITVRMDMSDFRNRPLPSLPVIPPSPSSFSVAETLAGSQDDRSSTSSRSKVPHSQRRARIFTIIPKELDLVALDSATIPTSELPSMQHSRSSSYDESFPATPTTPALLSMSRGSSLTLVASDDEDWQRPRYIPGPIRLSDSPFEEALVGMTGFDDIQLPLPVPASRKTTDDSAMDDIIDYFETFSLEPAGFNGDEFWAVKKPNSTTRVVPIKLILSPPLPGSPMPPPPPPKSPNMKRPGVVLKIPGPTNLSERRRSISLALQTSMHLNPTFLSTRKLVSNQDGPQFVF